MTSFQYEDHYMSYNVKRVTQNYQLQSLQIIAIEDS